LKALIISVFHSVPGVPRVKVERFAGLGTFFRHSKPHSLMFAFVTEISIDKMQLTVYQYVISLEQELKH
jgi:hypothetical protein